MIFIISIATTIGNSLRFKRMQVKASKQVCITVEGIIGNLKHPPMGAKLTEKVWADALKQINGRLTDKLVLLYTEQCQNDL